jgi:2-aminobenzoate-CoA ligase
MVSAARRLMRMKKYEGLPPEERPTTFQGLPELHYPAQLNIAQSLLEAAISKGFGAKVAYFCSGQRITYDTVRSEVHRRANALRRMGLREGDRIILRQEDTVALIYSVLAVEAIGAIAVPTYVQLRAEDLAYRIDDSSAKAIVVEPKLLGEVEGLRERCPSLRQVLVTPSDPTGRFSSIESPSDSAPFNYADTASDDICLILYTSGSTGQPKGTCHSHADLLSTPDTYSNYCLGLTSQDVIAGPPAIPFALGLGFFVHYTLRSGAAAVLSTDKSAQTLLANVTQFGVTIIVGVSTYFNRLSRLVAEQNLKMPELRLALCGGEPLPVEVEEAWCAASGVVLEQFLGTTEMLNIFLGLRHGISRPKTGVIGRAIPGYEISIRNPDTFELLGEGVPGLLCVRGPTGTHYLNKAEAQHRTVRDGWNVFQDLVAWDAEGYIRYIARHDEMIVTGGHSISPIDVEQILMKHPSVAECACTAAPDRTGERPNIVKAYVVLRESEVASEPLKRDLQEFFKRSAPPFMYPREIEFTQALPRTLNGKIQRSELRRIASLPASRP